MRCQEAHCNQRGVNGAEFSVRPGESWESTSTSWSYEQHWQQAIGDSDQHRISTAEGSMPWSSSYDLAPFVARMNVLCMAGIFTPLFEFIRSEWNPADAPSRLQ